MSHLIETMAYVGQVPWHGLGNPLSAQQPLDVWQREAGMDWTIEHSDVLFEVAGGELLLRPYPDSKVLHPGTAVSGLQTLQGGAAAGCAALL